MPDFEYPCLLSIILLKLENQINEILYLDYDEYFLYIIVYFVKRIKETLFFHLLVIVFWKTFIY